MNTVTTFETLANQWREHCEQVAFSSNMQNRLEHPVFSQLVKLGYAAVPLIMKRLADDSDELPWEFVLQEITHTRFISDSDYIDFEAARDKRMQWWSKRQREAASLLQ